MVVESGGRKKRAAVLTAVYAAHPERFVRKAAESRTCRGRMDQSAAGGRHYDAVLLHALCFKGVDR